MRVRTGQRIDRYELIEPLGAGGQGTVWKAADLLEGRLLRAVKLVPRERATPEAFERARREAHALAKAVHPALIACYGIFEDIQAGVCGIVLDFVDGEPLTDVLQDGRMTPTHRLAVLEQLADALAFVHDRKLVHRDLKPDNILVTRQFWDRPNTPGTVKLVDFGISVELGNPRPLTATGAVLGTIPYLAPELIATDLAAGAREQNDSRDFRRDIFAFGVLGVELLLGRHPTGLPVDASMAAFALAYRKAARGEAPFALGDLSGPWATTIKACLSLSPSQRPHSGAELLHYVHGKGAAAPRTELAMVTAPGQATTEPITAPVDVPRNESSSQRIEVPQYPRPMLRPLPSIPPPPPSAIPVTSPMPLFIGFGVMAVLVFGAIFLFMGKGEADGTANAMSPSIIPLPSASSTLRPDPVEVAPARPEPKVTNVPKPRDFKQDMPQVEPADLLACPSVCCGGALCATTSVIEQKALLCDSRRAFCEPCGSGRACIAGDCKEHIDPRARFQLRLAGALDPTGKTPLKTTHPRSEVCLRPSARRSERWTCTPAAASPEKCKQIRMPATTTDLHKDGIDVELREFGIRFASRYDVKYDEGIRVTALCQGLIVGNIMRGPQSYTVTLYLDEP